MTTSSRTPRILLAFFAIFVMMSSVSVVAMSSRASADPVNTSITNVNIPDPVDQGNGANDGENDEALHGVTGIIGNSARSALAEALNKLGLWTTPQVSPQAGDDGNNWFVIHYRMMRVMGLWILMPMVLIAIIHAVLKASVAMLLKTVLVYLPIAIVGTAVAVDLVQLLLNVTDDFSNVFLNATQKSADQFFTSVSKGFAAPGIPFFASLIMAILLAFVCVAVYVIMIVREGSIYIATSFLPIGFALMVWPSTVRFFRRMVEFLFGIVLSKLVMVAAVSLAIASLTAAAGGKADNGQSLSADGGNIALGIQSNSNNEALSWFGNVASSIALLLVVCLAPHMTIRLVANLGVGEMGAIAANHTARTTALNQLLFFDRIKQNKKALGRLVGASGDVGASKERLKNAGSLQQKLNAGGVYANAQGNYRITDEMLDKAGINDVAQRHQLMTMTDPSFNKKDANQILLGHMALAMGNDFNGFRPDASGALTVLDSKTNQTAIVLSINDRKGREISHHPPALIRNVIREEADRQIATQGGVTGINIIAPMPTRSPTKYDESQRVGAITNRDRRNERNIAQAVWGERSNYQNADGTAPRIRATFRTSAGMDSRVARPLDPRRARSTAGSWSSGNP